MKNAHSMHALLHLGGAQKLNPWQAAYRFVSHAGCLLAIMTAAFLVLTGLAQAQSIRITKVLPVQSNTNNPGNDTTVVSWTGGTGPFQLQSSTDYNTPWQDVAAIAFGSSQTNIQIFSGLFYRVADVGGIIATSLDNIAPTIPTGLTATTAGSQEVDLTWNASTDSGKNATGVKGYNIYRNGIFLTQVPATNTAFADVYVAPSSSNTYSIASVDYAYNQSALSTTVNAATPQLSVNCTYTISPLSATFAASGGSSNITVSAGNKCSWTATSGTNWITIISGASSKGNGAVKYSVAANITTNARASTMNIAGQIVTISQSAHTPPVAGAGLSRSAAVGTPVTFNGSATPSDGATITNYSWSFGDSTSAAGSNVVSHAYISAGTNIVTLTVTDSFGSSASATTTAYITNLPTPLSITLTNPVNGSTVSGIINPSVTASANVAKVVYFCDSNSVATNTTAPFTTAWNTKTTGNGSHNLYAKAYDNSTNSVVSATNSVIVNNVSVTPLTAWFGAAGGASNVTVTAASIYAWTAATGSSWITITSATNGTGNGTVTYSVSPNASGVARTNILTLQGQGITNAVTISQSAHTPPVANAGTSQSAAVGSSVTFNGSATASDGATITNYSWSFGDSTSASGPNVSHVYTTAGTNTVTLTVMDSFGGSASATTTAYITNLSTPLSITLTNPVNGSTVSGIINPSVMASANVARVIYYCDSNSVATNTTAPFTTTWSTKATGNGSHNLYAKAYDNSTNSVVSATNSVIVNNVSVTPLTVSFGAAGGASNVTVTAASSYAWTAASGASWITITSATNGMGSGTVNYSVAPNASAGTRTNILIVQGQGITNSVTISQSGHMPPVASAGTSQSAGVGSLVTFNGSATASDGAIVTNYSWSFGDATTASGTNVSHVYTTAGTNTVTLTVMDSFGASASAASTIYITNVPAPLSVTLVNPVSGSTVSNTVTLAASATNAVRVVFYCDGASVVTNTTAPFNNSSWNSMSASNGSHKLYAQAFDASNNSMMSVTNAVMVNNAVTAKAGTLLWLQTNQPPYQAKVNAVATDHAGNVVAVGVFAGNVDFGTGLITGIGDHDIFVIKYNSQGTIQWVKEFGGIGYDSANGVAIDSSNNIIVVGTFQGNANFGGTNLTANGGSLDQDAFVAEFSSSGTNLWAKNFGGAGTEVATAVAVDGNDNIIVVAEASMNVNFGNGITCAGHGGYDVGVVKFQGMRSGPVASGTTLWAQLFGGVYNDIPNGVAVDHNGDVYVTGSLGASANLGGTPFAGSTATGAFVAKYSGNNGNYVWAQVFAGNAGYGITVDPNSANIFVTGQGNGGFFLSAYDPSGNLLWNYVLGGSGNAGYAIAADGGGNIVLTGMCGYVGWPSNNQNGSGFFAASYTTSGSFNWAVQTNPSTSQGNGVAFDSLGHVVVVGSFSGAAVDFGGISCTTSAPSNAFVAQYAK
jgi:hypothetical protein